MTHQEKKQYLARLVEVGFPDNVRRFLPFTTAEDRRCALDQESKTRENIVAKKYWGQRTEDAKVVIRDYEERQRSVVKDA